MLVQQLLLGRTEGMSPARLAAFIDGWTSLLELLKRPEVYMPAASEAERRAVRALVERVELAQRRALGEDAD